MGLVKIESTDYATLLKMLGSLKLRLEQKEIRSAWRQMTFVKHKCFLQKDKKKYKN